MASLLNSLMRKGTNVQYTSRHLIDSKTILHLWCSTVLNIKKMLLSIFISSVISKCQEMDGIKIAFYFKIYIYIQSILVKTNLDSMNILILWIFYMVPAKYSSWLLQMAMTPLLIIQIHLTQTACPSVIPDSVFGGKVAHWWHRSVCLSKCSSCPGHV